MPLSKLQLEYREFSEMCQAFMAGWQVCEATKPADDLDDLMAEHVNQQRHWSAVRRSGIISGWIFASLHRRLSACHTPITSQSH